MKKTILASSLMLTSLSMAASQYVIKLDSNSEYEIEDMSIVVEGEWSDWTNTGNTYDCTNWTPEVSTVDWGVNFNQGRNCSQDQERERKIYNEWKDGSRTIKETEQDEQIISVSEQNPSVGTRKTREMCINIYYRDTTSPDGVYQVDPDGDGTAYSPRSAYCDMSGGGWTLYDGFGTRLVKTQSYTPAAYNKKDINSTTTLSSGGYTHYLTSINSTEYTTSTYYMQFYYSSAPLGYIQKTMPSWIEGVRIDSTNEWYGGTQSVRYGSSIKYIPAHEGYRKHIFNMSGGQLLKLEESGITWVDSVWVK